MNFRFFFFPPLHLVYTQRTNCSQQIHKERMEFKLILKVREKAEKKRISLFSLFFIKIVNFFSTFYFSPFLYYFFSVSNLFNTSSYLTIAFFFLITFSFFHFPLRTPLHLLPSPTIHVFLF